MCGDMDEEGGRLEDDLYTRFMVHARSILARQQRAEQPGSAADMNAYLDKLFADALSRCVKDAEGGEEAKRYEMISAQALVFARLAGFFAAHLALQEDPLRKSIDMLMHGYSEPEAIEPDHGHDHGHGEHDHHPGHGHHDHHH